jgi:hypothetical protein
MPGIKYIVDTEIKDLNTTEYDFESRTDKRVTKDIPAGTTCHQINSKMRSFPNMPGIEVTCFIDGNPYNFDFPSYYIEGEYGEPPSVRLISGGGRKRHTKKRRTNKKRTKRRKSKKTKRFRRRN